MSYKTILTVVEDREATGPSLAAAESFAQAMEAHLDVLCLGVDRTQTGYYFAGATALIHEETWALAQDDAKALEAATRKALANSDVPWSVEAVVTQPAGALTMVERRSRYADLVILPKPYGDDRGPEAAAIVETALFQGDAPVLVMPKDVPAPTAPKRVMIAWNQSAEAFVAVRRALPLLQSADVVDISMIAPMQHPSDTADPGAELCKMLVRHGVNAQVSILAQTLPRVSEALARHAADFDADLMVMGAYGHSRFREAILGGATRNMLEHAELPVFMAH